MTSTTRETGHDTGNGTRIGATEPGGSTTVAPAAPATRATGSVLPLGQPWRGVGPFLFASRHVDHYPRGNAAMGPDADLAGHNMGSDFGHRDGWNMYHGLEVPGFPAHPHRGFETITIAQRGVVDHADSTGASARYGDGDVQWVTAGNGVSHSEMFPLLDDEGDNEFELYQLWLNLPAANKSAPAEFSMQWSEDIPVVRSLPSQHYAGTARASVISGNFDGVGPLAAPKASWASDPRSDVAVWLIHLEPNSAIEIPATNREETLRMLYVHGDGPVEVSGNHVESGEGFAQTGQSRLHLSTGELSAIVLVLQGVDLQEPVAQHGPFVMNTQREIEQAFVDYQRTQFGGWPWNTNAPVHPRETPRFADYGDGRVEHPAG